MLPPWNLLIVHGMVDNNVLSRTPFSHPRRPERKEFSHIYYPEEVPRLHPYRNLDRRRAAGWFNRYPQPPER